MPDTAVLTGIVMGAGAVLLSMAGNPVHSGICISCFLENLAGALQFHDNLRMSYVRPELPGFLLGSFFMAVRTRRFQVTGGSSPLIRFFLGFFMIVGCAVFIGCPVKLLLRLAGGDLTGIAALAGLVFGISLAGRYIRQGVRFEPEQKIAAINGSIMPILALVLLIFLLLRPAVVHMGMNGPAAAHAPVMLSLCLGLLIGSMAQRSGFCITGGLRNYFLFREKTLLYGVAACFLAALIVSLCTGRFTPGLYGQPASHLQHGWTFLAMTLVGLAAVLVDGCPFRQVIKAGQGDVDAAVTCFGMLTGGALVINWQIRATSAGVGFNGRIAVLTGLIFCLVVVLFFRRNNTHNTAQESGDRKGA